MSTNSNNRGRAYEYAWIKILYEALYKLRQTKITKNSSLAANERAWSGFSGHARLVLNFSKRCYRYPA